MYLPVTEQSQPVLFADRRRRWTKIGEGEYYQSDTRHGLTLEVHFTDGHWRWFVYDDKSPEPDVAMILEDEATIEAALAAAYDYIDGNYEENRR